VKKAETEEAASTKEQVTEATNLVTIDKEEKDEIKKIDDEELEDGTIQEEKEAVEDEQAQVKLLVDDVKAEVDAAKDFAVKNDEYERAK
jgi:hypothetical protein